MVGTEHLTRTLGISTDQAHVYLAALELGGAHMQALSKKSGVNRSTIYTFIDKLKERGLIIETKKRKRRLYSAVNPKQLQEIEKRRVTELEAFVPELSAIANTSRAKPHVTFYEGLQGVKDVHADMLTASKEILAYEDLESLKKNLPESFFNYHPKERARRQIRYRSILRSSPTAKRYTAS